MVGDVVANEWIGLTAINSTKDGNLVEINARDLPLAKAAADVTNDVNAVAKQRCVTSLTSTNQRSASIHGMV